MSDIRNQLRILLVDDDAEIQRPYLKLFIEQSFPDVQISEAGSLEEAMKVIDETAGFFAAVVDLCLPDIESQKGLCVLKYLNEKQPACMRILVTHRLHERDVVDKSNVEAFVSIHHSKSSQLSMLSEALNEAVRRYWRRLEPNAEVRGIPLVFGPDVLAQS